MDGVVEVEFEVACDGRRDSRRIDAASRGPIERRETRDAVVRAEVVDGKGAGSPPAIVCLLFAVAADVVEEGSRRRDVAPDKERRDEGLEIDEGTEEVVDAVEEADDGLVIDEVDEMDGFVGVGCETVTCGIKAEPGAVTGD